MRRLALLTLTAIVAGTLASACGTPMTPAAGQTSRSVSKLPCPLSPEGTQRAAADCVSIDPNANISANNAYRDYRSPATAAQAEAEPVKAKLPSVLHSIRAHPPVTEQAVSAALRAAFPELSSAIEVSAHAARTPGNAVGYGIFVGGACVHGWVGPDDQRVQVDGVSKDGGCLPLLGH